MGEKPIYSSLQTDAHLADENCSKITLKDSRECAVNSCKAGNLNMQAAIETLALDSCSTAVSMCPNENVQETIEVQTPDEKLVQESVNDGNTSSAEVSSSKVEATCQSEYVFYTTEVETPQERSTLEYLSVKSCRSNKEHTSNLESMKESALDTTQVEPLDDENCSLNDEKSFKEESNYQAEFDLNTTGTEDPDDKPANESSISDQGSRAELKRPHECIVDATQTENPRKIPTISSSNDDSSSRVRSRCFNKCVMDGNEVNPTVNTPEKGFPIGDGSFGVALKCSHIDTTEAEKSNNKPVVDLFSDCRVGSKYLNECSENDAEVDTANNKQAKELLNEENYVRVDPTCSNECAIDATEVETSDKTLAKDFSTESSSEIFNPNVSSQENISSSQPVSSQGVEGLSSSGDSSREIADKSGFCDDSPAQFKSEFILDGSSSVSGIRRIIFKFSKSYNKYLSSLTRHPSYTKIDNGFSFSQSQLPEEFNINHSRMAMLKKGLLEKHTSNVRQFLSTGVLEGVEVKYITPKIELRGIIKDCGYLCGCTLCNFSKVLSAVEFEQHAGIKTAHPNNHLFLENGKSLHGIIQELKNKPEGTTLEGMIRTLLGPLFNEKSYLEWKDSLKTEDLENKTDEMTKLSHSNSVDFSQSTVSFRCSSQDTVDSLDSASRSMMHTVPAEHNVSMAHHISKRSKRVAKNFKTTLPSNIVGHSKKRDNDLHRLLFMPNGLRDGAELAYYAKGKKVLEGYKQGSGILCNCCQCEVSPSQFETHAGWAAKRQPYRHIYTSEGVSLHDLALSLAEGQRSSPDNSGGRCTICGDSGNLMHCVACTHAFHAACMDLQHTPEDEWYCMSCRDKRKVASDKSVSCRDKRKVVSDKTGSKRKVVSNVASGSVKPIIRRPIRIVKAPPNEIGGCVLCRLPDFILFKFGKRTVIFCNQCEKEYHVGCLWTDRFVDLKELPTGKWFCCEDCRTIHTTLEEITLSEAKVVPASITDNISRKLIQRGLTPKIGDDVQWQLIRGMSDLHQSLMSGVVSLFQDSFDTLVEKSGFNLIDKMVYWDNVGTQEFRGMYCAVLTVKSVVVSAGLLRVFGREVAELPLVATSKEEQGKGYFKALFSSIEGILRYLKIEKLVLPADDYAKSIWIDKFGFKTMPYDQFLKSRKDIQLVRFEGTTILEKILSQDPKPGGSVSPDIEDI